MQYRADIQALRALAVSVVLVFHALGWALPGGFLGVDVFFVVSGYLITLLLIHEHQKTGRISWTRFYARRVRRLGPALVVVLLFVLVWGWFWMLPSDYASMARTGAAAAWGLGNIELGWNTDYFGDDVRRNPLAHTWSLGVEEQFYLVWPFLVSLVLRKGVVWLFVMTFVLMVGGFTWAVWVQSIDPDGAYFRTDARVWELSAGAWLAAMHVIWPERFQKVSGWLVFCSIVVLLATFVWVDKTMAHPGWATIPIVVATLCLLHGGVHVDFGFVPRCVFVSVVFIGEISYALYLIHWPVFVFWTLELGRAFTFGEALFAMCVSIVLAWFLHIGVEKPIRYGKILFIGRPLVVLLGLVALSNIAFLVFVRDGYPSRVSDAVREAEVYSHPYYKLSRDCHFLSGDLEKSPCLLGYGGVSEGPPTWAVLGDSHATALVSGLMEVRGVEPFLALGVSGCPIVLGPETRPGRDCAGFTRFALDQIERHPTIRVVVLHMRWSSYGMDATARLVGESGFLSMEGVLERIGVVADMLRDRGYTVILVGPVPEQEWHVPKRIAEQLWYGREVSDLGVARFLFDSRHAAFKKWANSRSEVVVWPEDVLCSVSFCAAVFQDKQPLYYDDDHLSVLGASLVASQVWSMVKVFLPEIQ